MTPVWELTSDDVLALKARLGSAMDAWVADLAPIPDPEPDPDPEPVLEPPAHPMATPGNGQIILTWEAPQTGDPIGYRYGRDGTDTAGTGPWSGTLGPDARTATLDKLINGQTYEVGIHALYPTGYVGVSLAVTPAGPPNPDPDPGPPPPAGDRRVPLVGLSGLTFNSIAFLPGAPSKAGMEQFGRDRGRPMDGLLTFPPRGSWDDLRQTPVAELKSIITSGGIVVYSMPHAPTSEGTAMNEDGANDDYRAHQRAFGGWLAAVGLNSPRFVVRVDWEFNGDWYPWSAKHGGAEALKAAIRNFVTNLRAGGATKVRFDLCENKLPSQSGYSIPEVMPGPEYIDVLGLDMYDHWGPSFTTVQWAGECAKGFNQNVALAKRLGIQWSIDECGNAHPADRNHGGDNPSYWQFLLASVRAEAASCAWHNTYLHPGAPASLRHDFASNPASYRRYKELLAGG